MPTGSPAPPTNVTAVGQSFELAAPSITAVSLPAAILGQVYTGSINASGGLQPYSWSLDSGALPPGLALKSLNASSASITGIPTSTGLYSFTLLCTDAAQQTTQISLT